MTRRLKELANTKWTVMGEFQSRRGNPHSAAPLPDSKALLKRQPAKTKLPVIISLAQVAVSGWSAASSSESEKRRREEGGSPRGLSGWQVSGPQGRQPQGLCFRHATAGSGHSLFPGATGHLSASQGLGVSLKGPEAGRRCTEGKSTEDALLGQ